MGASDCRFHIHTHVGGFCVSTIGDYRPRTVFDGGRWRDRRDEDPPEPIGYQRLYETMVFKLDDDGENVSDWLEVGFGAYQDDKGFV